MINLQIGNQSNSIYMGGKVKLIDALNESNVSSIQPILQYIESNKITELLEDISTLKSLSELVKRLMIV